jgi:hypothetical protein
VVDRAEVFVCALAIGGANMAASLAELQKDLTGRDLRLQDFPRQEQQLVSLHALLLGLTVSR